MRKLLSLLLLLVATQVFSMAHKVDIQKAIEDAVQKYGVQTDPHLRSYFTEARVAYPPQQISLLAFKKEQQLQLWAKNENHGWRYIHTYPLTAKSGHLGPKLRERDGQIPEGIYRLTSLNPFSMWHLSMMINYPNEFDRQHAVHDRRHKLGGNIFIHGKDTSAGCLAVGDAAINELFYLTYLVGLDKVQLIIAPNDLRIDKPATNTFLQPQWVSELYEDIYEALQAFPINQRVV